MFNLLRIMPRKSLIYKALLLELVTPAGFEPATFGAEIRNSIQLNYGAICSKGF